jgi:hypothetical protein
MDKLPKSAAADTYRDERRKSTRHLLTGRVWFQWRTVDGNWYDGVGTTRDIGKTGVFVQCESIPPVASTLKLIVVLPTGWETDTTVCLSGLGHVRHVPQEPRQKSGFGASAVFQKEVPMSMGSTQEKQRLFS